MNDILQYYNSQFCRLIPKISPISFNPSEFTRLIKTVFTSTSEYEGINVDKRRFVLLGSLRQRVMLVVLNSLTTSMKTHKQHIKCFSLAWNTAHFFLLAYCETSVMCV